MAYYKFKIDQSINKRIFEVKVKKASHYYHFLTQASERQELHLCVYTKTQINK